MTVKVCHLTSIHPRYDARILLKQCASLAKAGYEVSLIVNDDKPNEHIHGVSIISTGFVPKNRIDRFRHSNKIMLEAAKKMDADIYQFHDPDLMRVGNALKKMKKKVIYDMHEDVPVDIAYKEWIPTFGRKPISWAAFQYEKKYINQYDAVFTVTPHVCERVKKLNEHTHMITNYPILKEVEVVEDKPIVKNSEIILCFAGAIVQQWQHEEILLAIASLSNVRYVLAGPCQENYLKKLQSLAGWDKVTYYGKISHEEVHKMYQSSTIGMALLMYSPTTGNKIGTLGNTKLFEYMAEGLPIICSASDVWKDIIQRYQCGIAVEPNRVTDISQAIEYLKTHPIEAEKMGKNGQFAAKKEFNWETQEKKLITIYQDLSLAL